MNTPNIDEVSKLIGVSPQTLRNYYAGTGKPDSKKRIERKIDAAGRPDLLREETRKYRAMDAFETEVEAQGLVPVSAPGARPIMQKWVDRGDRIGVFRNADLGHYDLGRRVFLPINAATVVTVGQTKAPDGSYGMGWRYILDRVEATLDAFRFLDEAVV